MNHRATVLVFLLAVSLAGCEPRKPPGSAQFNTIGLKPAIEVISSVTSETVVSARMQQVTGGPVRLDSGDELHATGCGLTNVLLSFSGTDYDPVYTAKTASDCSDESVKVSFTRANDIPAPNSTVTLPVSFEVASPQPGSSWPLSASIQVAWTGGDSPIDLKASGTCRDQNNAVRDIHYTKQLTTGLTEIAALDVVGTPQPGANDVCAFSLSLERVNPGQADSAFGGGSVIAKQTRSMDIHITP